MPLLLLLALISAVLAQIPTGCVYFLSVKPLDYLVPDKSSQSKLRFVRLGLPEKWIVEKNGTYYRLLNPAWNEYMMILDAPMDPDHTVFTIERGTKVRTDEWKIEKEGKYYIIENVKYPECLYVSKEKYVHSKVPKKAKDCVKWEIRPCK